MGLQYGGECWCGSLGDEEQHTQYGNGTCNKPCSGDSSEICGTSNAYFDKRTDAPPPSRPFTVVVVKYKYEVVRLPAPLFGVVFFASVKICSNLARLIIAVAFVGHDAPPCLGCYLLQYEAPRGVRVYKCTFAH